MLSFKSLRQALLMGVATFGTTAAVSAIEQPAFAQAVTRTYNIPAQDLNSALREFALQTGRDVLYPPEIVAGKRSNGAQGQLTERQALEALLAGTGLRFEQTASNGYAVQDPAFPTQLGDARRVAPSEGNVDEEIVVIGTNIRGVYPSSSPVDIYTAEDIARTGATTTEQFIQKLPQTLGTRSQFAVGSTISLSSNRESVSSVDLRGLGVGTTLSLMNGRRLGRANFGRGADISLIPVGAVERVDVLTDGASAIYGSDAIGGVVNFVLRDDFDGAETRLTYGGVTSGSLRQGGATQTIGRAWGSGNVLASLDYFSASALANADRSFAASSGPGDLTPTDQRYGALITGDQRLTPWLTLNADFMYSDRDVKSSTSDLTAANPLNHSFQVFHSDTQQHFGNLGLEAELSDTLTATLLTSYSGIDVDSESFLTRFNRVPPQNSTTLWDTNYSSLDLTATLDGEIGALPAGVVRFALGAGYTQENYEAGRVFSGGVGSGADFGRSTAYAFGELLVPLLSADQNVPLINRLELSLAARYTRYDDTTEPPLGRDFGERVSPKLGIVWEPIPEVSLRATYGESFRAPFLDELDPSSTRNSVFLNNFAVAGTVAPILQVQGPAADLDAETANTYTIGFDIRPSNPDLRISGTYFSIDYQDRIAVTGLASVLPNPSNYPELMYHPSSAQEIEDILRTTPNSFNNSGINLSDPHAAALALFALPNLWINDGRVRNLALTQINGFDLNASQRFQTETGDFTIGLQLTKIFEFEEQSTPNAPIANVVDTVLRPVDIRGRGFINFSRDAFDATLNVNYVDNYTNPAATSGVSIDSWTTYDLALTYDFTDGESDLQPGLRLGFGVQNLFDEDPPLVRGNTGASFANSSGFDPANANPLGRVLTLTITKTW